MSLNILGFKSGVCYGVLHQMFMCVITEMVNKYCESIVFGSHGTTFHPRAESTIGADHLGVAQAQQGGQDTEDNC